MSSPIKHSATALLLLAGSLLAPRATAYVFGDPILVADNKLLLDFNARIRVESRDNTFDFNSATKTVNDDTFTLTRLRIGAKYTFSPKFVLYGQLQDSPRVRLPPAQRPLRQRCRGQRSGRPAPTVS